MNRHLLTTAESDDGVVSGWCSCRHWRSASESRDRLLSRFDAHVFDAMVKRANIPCRRSDCEEPAVTNGLCKRHGTGFGSELHGTQSEVQQRRRERERQGR